MTSSNRRKQESRDPFLATPAVAARGGSRSWGGRPRALQQVIDTMGNVVVSPASPLMANFTGCKVIHKLQKPGAHVTVAGDPAIKGARPASFDTVLRLLAKQGAQGRGLSEALAELRDAMVWHQGPGGPYASVNFERDHAHAVLIGEHGLEQRSDVRIGLTLLAPYTRFPDFIQPYPSVVLPLTDGEFTLEAGDWSRRRLGTALHYPAGSHFAVRSTARPLMMLWAHLLQSR